MNLKEVAQKIRYVALLELIEYAEKCLHMLPEVCINDNDTLLLLLNYGKNVNVCWRLAKLSRTVETAVTNSRENFYHIPLQRIGLGTWHTIRQLLALMHRTEKKKLGHSFSL